ncbi:hypothetical protein HOY82DRAFT_607389 [Tuber indicum]|nr:hypothetical protein HOY82DRAFT_607389 [Tuber indicum]
MPSADMTQNEKKRKPRWEISYSKMTQSAAGKRLGHDFEELESQSVPVDDMLEGASCVVGCLGGEAIKETKEKVTTYLLVRYFDSSESS